VKLVILLYHISFVMIMLATFRSDHHQLHETS